jgi:hypothetical protein
MATNLKLFERSDKHEGSWRINTRASQSEKGRVKGLETYLPWRVVMELIMMILSISEK